MKVGNMATLSNIIFAAVKNIQAQRRGKVVWTVFFLGKKNPWTVIL